MPRSNFRIERPVINGKPSKVWYVCFTEGGRSYRVSTRQVDRRLAEQFLAQYEAARNAPPERFTIEALCTAYDAERRASGVRSQTHHLKAVNRLLGNLTPSSLTRERIRMFHQTRREEGVSDSTINRQCRSLRAALSWGVKEGWMISAPYIDAPPPNDERERFLTYEEVKRLFGAAKTYHLRTFIALAVWTGARAGAIYQLKWEHIDPDQLLIYWPPGTLNKRRPRVTAINQPLALALGVASLLRDSEFVVSWQGNPIQSIKGVFYRAAAAAGLDDITIHDLRRTAASWVLLNGGSFDDAAALLEDDVRTVQRRYARFNVAYMREISDRIAR